MSDRDRSYDYISTRRLEELEARITPSWFVRVIRQIGGHFYLSLEHNWSRVEPP
jgi:hypothetical protein